MSSRFLSDDTYAETLTEPCTQNRYAYVGNNPINMWDPTGHVPNWVRAGSDYTVQNSHTDYFNDNTGELEAQRDYHEYYAFNSYSKTDGTTR